MSETYFETGKTYPTRGGGTGHVTEINWATQGEYPLTVTYTHGVTVMRDWATADGKFYTTDDTSYDLLLPAIEPAKGFSGPTIRAMRDLQDFWAHFRDSIKCGKIDPTCGGEWPEHNDLAVISCTYPCEAAALSDCDRVIAGVDALLGGRAG